jgi:alpha-mannosidase
MLSRRSFIASTAAALPALGQAKRDVYLVPNFHPASCGWLTNFSLERVYCANSYFDHLDRVRDDPEYAFVLSECNNLMAMMKFKPERMPELKRRIADRRVELVNGFFLESTINLSGGEALVRLGIEGQRWQRAVFGVKPRIAWNIDVCGTHDQMAQIVSGLGLEAIVYTRKNRTGSAVFWSESPDGTRVLSFVPGHYSDLGEVIGATGPLDDKALQSVTRNLDAKQRITPDGLPILVLAGKGDYNLAPAWNKNPHEFLKQWRTVQPDTHHRFTTMTPYLDAVQAAMRTGAITAPTKRGGTEYDFCAFWVQSPRVKTVYRSCEHALQSAEMLSTIASLHGDCPYPAETLYHAWLQMFLNMDRNTLWGAAGGMVFEHDQSWDAADRFRWVAEASHKTTHAAAATLLGGAGDALGLYNPLNWNRNDPVILSHAPYGRPAQDLGNGKVLARPDLPALSCGAWNKAVAAPVIVTPLPATIETKFHSVRIDGRNGALVSLKLKPSGKELLGGPANVLVAERNRKQRGDPGDFVNNRAERDRVATTNEIDCTITAADGPLATIVRIESTFIGGGPCSRTITFYKDHPRIDFSTELNDIPNRTIIVAEFPLAQTVAEIRRAIPYGFSHGAWERPDPDLPGWTTGVCPAVRWSHYSLDNACGFAILDRGLSGREITGRTPLIFLLNATDKYYGYPNAWLSGKGRHVLEYAIVPHAGDWRTARIPQMAWEYNAPPIELPAQAPVAAESWLTTSDNVIVESMRREGREIELRLVECLGFSGSAQVQLRIPHTGAFLTDMTGGHRKPLHGGPTYEFPVRPQQIVTLRFGAATEVPIPKPLLAWDPLVPEHKREALNRYSSEKGHPPKGA